jgi:hypothetical protein
MPRKFNPIAWARWFPMLAWVTVGLLAISAWVILTHREPCIRWWGTLLQLVGVGTVLNELRSSLNPFGRSLADDRRALWARRPSAPYVLTAATGSMHARFGTPFVLRGSIRPGPGVPLDVRIAALEAQADAIQQNIHTVTDAIAKERADRIDSQEREASARSEEISQLRQKASEAIAGSPWSSIFGIGWLAVGVVLGGTSNELAKWLGKLLA